MRLKFWLAAAVLLAFAAHQLVMATNATSDYLENKVVEHFTGKGSTSAPSSVWLALTKSGSTPTDATTGTITGEADYTGYARVQINPGDWNAASGGIITNAVAITFGAVTAGSNTITGWVLCDAATNGNALWWGTTTSKVVDTTNSPPNIAAGALSIQQL